MELVNTLSNSAMIPIMAKPYVRKLWKRLYDAGADSAAYLHQLWLDLGHDQVVISESCLELI